MTWPANDLDGSHLKEQVNCPSIRCSSVCYYVDLRYFNKKLNGSNIAYNLVRVLSKWGVDVENHSFWSFPLVAGGVRWYII